MTRIEKKATEKPGTAEGQKEEPIPSSVPSFSLALSSPLGEAGLRVPALATVPRSKILVVDDEKSIRVTLQAFLQEQGYEVEIAEDAAKARELIAAGAWDVVVSDIVLPGMSGVELLKAIHSTAPHVQVIMMTGEPTVETASEVVRTGASDYLTKPVSKNALLRSVAHAIQIKILKDERLAREVLELLNRISDIPTAIRELLQLLKARTGFEAVGIRLREGDDFPYFVQSGFTDEFLKTENSLVARDKNGGVCRNSDGSIRFECTCGLVISGKTDPANALFTEGGSCWTNNSLPMLDLPAGKDSRLNPRNRCIHDGFLSIALIPLRSGPDIIGLLQFNDSRPNQLTLEMIRFYEGLGCSIGIVLARQRVEEELKRSNVALSRRNDELRDFYHTVSHELKTPLTSAREFTSILLDGIAGPLTQEQKQYLALILESCNQLQFCVGDLLEAVRLETGKMEIRSTAASLETLVANVVAAMKPAMNAKGIELRGEVETNLVGVSLDERRISQVCLNLLSNALKFTPSGGVVTVRVSDDPDNVAMIRFAVSDTGRGIAAEHLERIFDKLYQVKETDSSIVGGVGLGLYIASGIVRLHGGRMWVASKVGMGSTFYFTLPRRAPPVRHHILFVDDDRAAQQIVSVVLEQAGYEVSLAGDGAEALRMVEGQAIDLAIVDLCLQGMPGPVLLRELRRLWSDLPLLLYTGYPDSQLMTQAMEVSPLTLLTKSCTGEKFVATVRDLLEREERKEYRTRMKEQGSRK